MRNSAEWRPTKYAPRKGRWQVSRDPKELLPASRLSSSLALSATERAIRQHARGHLIDLGCGTAPFFGIYRELVEEVTCVDWPESPHAIDHVDVAADLNRPWDLPGARFDTILSSSVLEHIWNHDVFWNETARVLRPGGKAILIVPFLYWLHEEPHDYFRWTRHALARACEERGLRVLELEPYGGGPDVLADLLVRSIAAVSMRLSGWSAELFIRLLGGGLSRRIAGQAHSKLPLGYVLVAEKPG